VGSALLRPPWDGEAAQAAWRHEWHAAKPQMDTNTVAFSREVSMQVADVEVRHARNRRSTSACGQTSWPQLASKYVLRELACLHQARAAECRLWLGRDSREDHDESVARPGSERERLSAQSALQLFRHDILKRDAGLGIKIGAANKDDWAQIKGEFQMLPADRRATYEAQAQASRVEARAGRKRRSLCQAASAEKEVVRLSSAVVAGAPRRRPCGRWWRYCC